MDGLATFAALVLNGLVTASTLFLVAAGLTLIFGVTRVVNFAHGSLYMVGAYSAWTVSNWLGGVLGGDGAFLLSILGGMAAAAVLGLAIEVLLLRRIYHAPELFQLLATFGVVLVIQDMALWIWGPEDLLGPRVPSLRGAVDLFGRRFPEYNLLIIALGPVVLAALLLVFRRTRFGVLVRAATEDREMVAALGVDQARLFTGVFVLGSALAGLAGAVQVPREAVNLGMDLTMIVEAFAVVVIGGMGSIGGAFLAALLIGMLQSFGVLIFPKLTLVLVFLVMAIVLMLRPQGLLGRVQHTAHGIAGPGESQGVLRFKSRGPLMLAGGVLLFLVLATAPVWLGDFWLGVATETMILALFAASLHLMMGPGGMTSFGHAAFFGLGAYGAALAMQAAGGSGVLALVTAILMPGLTALIFGLVAVRLTGVYFAMLTLALAQIVWSIAVQWIAVTGGDNGILGVQMQGWLGGREAFYFLTLVLVTLALAAIRHLVFSPFGLSLRAVRDHAARAAASGMDGARIRQAALGYAGMLAGLAGGLYTLAKGSAFPNVAAVAQSTDALVMVLLGGMESLMGPVLGAAVYHTALAKLMSVTVYWRALIGLLILALVVLLPFGLAGGLRRLHLRLRHRMEEL